MCQTQAVAAEVNKMGESGADAAAVAAANDRELCSCYVILFFFFRPRLHTHKVWFGCCDPLTQQVIGLGFVLSTVYPPNVAACPDGLKHSV
jgi:hypothetical protein